MINAPLEKISIDDFNPKCFYFSVKMFSDALF